MQTESVGTSKEGGLWNGSWRHLWKGESFCGSILKEARKNMGTWAEKAAWISRSAWLGQAIQLRAILQKVLITSLEWCAASKDSILDIWQKTTKFCKAIILSLKRIQNWDFPGGPVVKNPSSNAGDMGSIYRTRPVHYNYRSLCAATAKI